MPGVDATKEAPSDGTERERIYLVSTAGHPNFGDELIAAAWLRHLALRRPDADVWLDCPQPGRAAVLLDGTHPRLRVTDTLWRVSQQAHGDDRVVAHARARELVAVRGTPREDLGLELVEGADVIHMIGGGHLTSIWPANLLLPTIVSELVRRGSTIGLMTGVGLLPMDDDDVGLVRDALADLTFVETRDSPSAERFGIERGVDDAFLALGSSENHVDARPSPRGMLLLQGDVHRRDVMAGAVTQALELFRREGLEGETIGVLEAVPPDDAWLLDEVRDRWGEVRFYPFAEVWKEGLPAREGQVWVTSRFHAHLVAAACGARGIAVNTGNEYYDIKHHSLLAHGTGWAFGTAGEDWPAVPAVAGFPSVARGLAERKVHVADRLYPAAARRRGLFGR
jgi:polysaccharide pyruvyl transferase WcaK-like protein